MAQRSRGLYIAMALRLFVLIFAVIVCMKIYVGREQPPAAAPVTTIALPSGVRIGDLTLPAGEYRVRHVRKANQDFMLFVATGEAKSYAAPCRIEPLSATVNRTEQRYGLDLSGSERLVELTLEGDPHRHVF